jgi:hypothetical protein
MPSSCQNIPSCWCSFPVWIWNPSPTMEQLSHIALQCSARKKDLESFSNVNVWRTSSCKTYWSQLPFSDQHYDSARIGCSSSVLPWNLRQSEYVRGIGEAHFGY